MTEEEKEKAEEDELLRSADDHTPEVQVHRSG
jgi:hypothetical protein